MWLYFSVCVAALQQRKQKNTATYRGSGWWFIWIVRYCTDLQILNLKTEVFRENLTRNYHVHNELGIEHPLNKIGLCVRKHTVNSPRHITTYSEGSLRGFGIGRRILKPSHDKRHFPYWQIQVFAVMIARTWSELCCYYLRDCLNVKSCKFM
jgi:hypothetical protein